MTLGRYLNGLAVDRSKAKEGNTIFVPLRKALWTPCGPCGCVYCAKYPFEVPSWDTLALAADPKRNRSSDCTWLVHRPEANPWAGEDRRES